ncbi:hypothetical protein [Streptomyces sp. NPDC051577]|uniref:hypothetical protein n=1 Tax=Streptomyces sp. NPDC051577 TaxID=3155166 RepID=UPI003435166D
MASPQAPQEPIAREDHPDEGPPPMDRSRRNNTFEGLDPPPGTNRHSGAVE